MSATTTRLRRIWQTDSGTVCLRTENYMGEEIIREFWVPPNGGYVREIDAAHPGTLGSQVCKGLSNRGATLWAFRATLSRIIRAEYRQAVRREN